MQEPDNRASNRSIKIRGFLKICTCYSIKDLITAKCYATFPSSYTSRPLTICYEMIQKHKIIDLINSCINQEKTISTGLQLTQKGDGSRLVQHWSGASYQQTRASLKAKAAAPNTVPSQCSTLGQCPSAISEAGEALHPQVWPIYTPQRPTSCWLGTTGQLWESVLAVPGHTEL